MSMWDSAHWTCGSWTIVRFGRPKKPLHKGSKKSQKKAIGKLLCSFQSRKHNPWSWVHKKGDEINCATLQKFVAQSLLLYLVKVSKMRAFLKSPMCDQRMEQWSMKPKNWEGDEGTLFQSPYPSAGLQFSEQEKVWNLTVEHNPFSLTY